MSKKKIHRCTPRRQLTLFCVNKWSEGNNTARSGGNVRGGKQTQYQSPSARSTLEVCSQLNVPKTSGNPGGTAVKPTAKSTTAAVLPQVFPGCPNSHLLSRADPRLVTENLISSTSGRLGLDLELLAQPSLRYRSHRYVGILNVGLRGRDTGGLPILDSSNRMVVWAVPRALMAVTFTL